MNLIRDLMEYGELRLWNCDSWFYAELVLEIPSQGCSMLMTQEATLESALDSLLSEVKRLRETTPSQSDHTRNNSDMTENRSGE